MQPAGAAMESVRASSERIHSGGSIDEVVSALYASHTHHMNLGFGPRLTS